MPSGLLVGADGVLLPSPKALHAADGLRLEGWHSPQPSPAGMAPYCAAASLERCNLFPARSQGILRRKIGGRHARVRCTCQRRGKILGLGKEGTCLQLGQVRPQDGGVEGEAARVQLAHKHALRLQRLQQRLDVLLRTCGHVTFQARLPRGKNPPRLCPCSDPRSCHRHVACLRAWLSPRLRNTLQLNGHQTPLMLPFLKPLPAGGAKDPLVGFSGQKSGTRMRTGERGADGAVVAADHAAGPAVPI